MKNFNIGDVVIGKSEEVFGELGIISDRGLFSYFVQFGGDKNFWLIKKDLKNLGPLIDTEDEPEDHHPIASALFSIYDSIVNLEVSSSNGHNCYSIHIDTISRLLDEAYQLGYSDGYDSARTADDYIY